MGKGHDNTGHEHHKADGAGHEHKKADAHAHEHKKSDAAGHEHKKSDVAGHEHKKPEGGGHQGSTSKAKGHSPMPDGCNAWGCKAKAKRFSFCDEHYDHFKFGLIKKTGEPVSDYEKKIEHYLAYKAKQAAQKVA